MVIITGCELDERIVLRKFIDNLADTIYVDEPSREVLLTDGTGGFYYDDAFRTPYRGEYGFSVWQRKFVSGWWILDSDGNRLDMEPEFCIVHPEWVERHFASGIIERVEMPLNVTVLVVTIDPGPHKSIIIRPMFDFSLIAPLDTYQKNKKVKYALKTNEDASSFTIDSRDKNIGRIVVAFDGQAEFNEHRQDVAFSYRSGQLTGRIGSSTSHAVYDIVCSGSREISIAFGHHSLLKPMMFDIKTIFTKRDKWLTHRQAWSENILQPLMIECENRQFEKAFAWARLTLAKMITGERNGIYGIHTGIPYSPNYSGWYTMLSLAGIAVSDGHPRRALKLMERVIESADHNRSSLTYGWLPTEFGSGWQRYRIPLISGLAAVVYPRLREMSDSVDVDFERKLVKSLAQDFEAAVGGRMLESGLIYSGPPMHFMRDTPAGPERSGATIETQALFGAEREFLRSSPMLEEISPGLPPSVLKGCALRDWRMTSPPLAVGAGGSFKVPLETSQAMNLFHNRDLWYDRLIIPYLGQSALNMTQRGEAVPLIPDSTLRISHILALGWYKPDNRKLTVQLLDRAIEEGLVGETGFRSLSSSEISYQSAHEYFIERDTSGNVSWGNFSADAPHGTVNRGDVLVWSAGRFADMLTICGMYDSLATLVDLLSDRVTNQGVTGGLPEAENAEPLPVGDNIVSDPVHCASLAEYVRLVVDNLTGIDRKSAGYVRFKPRFPLSWGRLKIKIAHAGGYIYMERTEDYEWQVGQDGISHKMQLLMEFSPVAGERASCSVFLKSGQSARVHLRSIGEDRWQAKVEM